jgi:hypothetical protein
MGIFSGVSKAKTDGRNDIPKIGKCIGMLQKTIYVPAHKARGRKAYFKGVFEVVKGLVDENGLDDTQEGYIGDVKGNVVDVFFIENPQFPEYFAGDLKKFGLTCLGATSKELISAEEKAAGKEGLLDTDFEDIYLPSILGVDSNGDPLAEGGMCDASVFVELRTYFKPNKDGITDDNGNLKGIILTDLVRKVTFAEASEFLSDETIKRLFGSLDTFNNMLAEDM